jgi:hypothetical protein
MTPEKQTKDPKAAQKQKVIIGIIVVVVLIALWQLIDTGGSSSVPTIAPTPVASAPGKPAVGSAMQAPSAGASMAAAPMAMPNAPAPASSEIRQEKISATSDLTKPQQQSQTEFISSLNKLQLLKLQREIDETKTAIATAELNRMTAEKSIADLITKQAIVAQPAVDQFSSNSSAASAPAPVPAAVAAAPAAVMDFPYTVMSVAYEGRRWTAVVSGIPAGATAPKLYTVSVGDILPLDGSTVVTIDKQGITVKKNTSSRMISLTSSSM